MDSASSVRITECSKRSWPLAHLPSGKYAAWLAHAVIAFNLARAAGVAALPRHARWATLRTHLINIPARLAFSGRRLFFDTATATT